MLSDMTGKLKVDDGFAERLRLAIGEESENAFATRSGVSRPLLRQYLTGSEPGMTKLVAIARAAGVSVEWLATGEGPMRPQAGRDDGVSSTANAARQIDRDLLALVHEKVAEVFRAENAGVSKRQLANEIARVYDDLVVAYDSHDKRMVGLDLALHQLRRELRTPAAGGASRKQVS